jgi:hypothetical protein
MLKKFTSHHMLAMTTILHQAHLDVELHIVVSALQCHAVSLPDSICNVLPECISCMWFVTEHIFLNIVP